MIAIPSPFLAKRAAATALLLLCACGGSQSTAPAAAGTAEKSGARALPADPLGLVPDGARELISVDLAQLRSSHHFATLDRLAREYGCFRPPAGHFFFGRTERAVVAGYGATGDPNARRLVLLRGRYQAGDARRALAEAQDMMSRPSPDAAAPPPITEQAQGGFQLFQQGARSAVQVDETTLALGDTPAVLAALEVAAGRQRALASTTAFVPGIDSRKWLLDSGHTVAGLTFIDAQAADQLGQRLAPMGGRRLGEGLTESAGAFAVVLASDLGVRAHVQYDKPESAAAAAEGLRSVLGRAGFVLQLTGMPPVLERTAVTADGARMNVNLNVTADEVRQILERVEPFLREGAQPCAAQAQAPSSGQPAVAAAAD